MTNGRAIILAAACAAALAGCGAGTNPAAGRPTPTPSSRSPAPAAGVAAAATAPASAPPASPRAASPGSASAAVLYLATSEQVPFAGDAVAVTVQASAGPGVPRWLRLASVTVSFGDGTAGSASQDCAGARPAPASGLSLRHRYRRPGLFTARVTSAQVCGRSGRPDLSWVTAAMRVLPAAPASAASWPACGGAGAVVTAQGTGAGLGHVGVLFTVHNTSGGGCRLAGYPALRLIGRGGPLPTTVHEAAAGTYLFPPVAPHLVALRPGGYAAFELEYQDNPSGGQAAEPYATACPAATGAEITLPGTRAAGGVVPAAMAPCGGDVYVSAVIPGRSWIGFP